MTYEFTVDELKEVIRAARIYCPGFSDEQFQSLIELERRLGDSGYLESVQGLARLEKKSGIACTEALDGYEKLLKRSADLEQKTAAQLAKLETVNGEYQQKREAAKQAKEHLQTAREKRQNEENELMVFRKWAEGEKQGLERELEECRRGANVTREEIVAAGSLKEQLASRGVTLQFTLDMCQELVGHENARVELGKAIEEHGTLTKSNAVLIEQNAAQHRVLESARNKTESLEEARHQLENIISQLQADAAQEEELRRFYRRYQGVGVLMEYLASWDQVYFLRCNNAVAALASVFDRSAACARFWANKPAARCPHCGLTMVSCDEQLYRACNLPVGVPLKLQLGE